MDRGAHVVASRARLTVDMEDSFRDPTPQSASPRMTPERWRKVDAILRASLACEADYRDTFVREACEGDEALRREVSALLAAHDGMSDSFLERPVIEAIGAPSPPMIQPNERIAQLLADALAGRYAIEHEIARGGMATVFLARDLRHDRR